MAKPQIEDGYTRIANEILEALYAADLNGTQFKIVLCIWRYTYGFQRKESEFSENFISKAICKHKNQVGLEIQRLIDRKIIEIKKSATFTSSRVLAFNKNYEEWGQKYVQSVNTMTPIEPTNRTVTKLTDTPVSEFTTRTVSEFTDQEKKTLKKYIKKNIKDNICSEPDKSAPTQSGIFLPLNDKSFYDVPLEKIELWSNTYPAVDVEMELRRMMAWLDSNPTKKKTRRGVERFINNWLRRTQDNGGSSSGARRKESNREFEEWLKEPAENPFERFQNLRKDSFEQYRAAGIIDDDGSIDCGLANAGQIKILQECGAL